MGVPMKAVQKSLGALLAGICCAGASAADEDDIKLTPTCQLEQQARETAQPTRGLGFSFGGFSFGGGRRDRDSAPGLSVDQFGILRDALRPELADRLAENGPRLQEFFSFSCIAIRGFVRAGWPLVIDYQAEEGTLVTLEIHPATGDPIVEKLNSGGERQSQSIHLPASLGDEPKPALLLLRTMRDQADNPAPGRMRAFSIGAGPRVQDAPAIDQITFQGNELSLGNKDLVSFAFHSRAAFKRATVDVLRLDERGDVLMTRLARSLPIAKEVVAGALIGQESPLVWNGYSTGQQVSLGPHLVQVRVWSAPADGGDWVAAWSSDTFRVKP